jgi:hypothetical protein
MRIKGSNDIKDAVRYLMSVEKKENGYSRAVGTKCGESHDVPTAQIAVSMFIFYRMVYLKAHFVGLNP